MTTETSTDCRTPTGITVGLIDGIIAVARVLRHRDCTAPEVREALADLRCDEDVQWLLWPLNVDRLVDLMDELIYAQDIAPDDPDLYLAFMGAFGTTLRENLDQRAAKRAGLRALILAALQPAKEAP